MIEHSLGKGEVDSSILSGSTSPTAKKARFIEFEIGPFIPSMNISGPKWTKML